MKLKVYTIKDTKVGEYQGLYPIVNGAVFARQLDSAVNAQGENPFNTFIEDKQAYCVGDFDSLTGEFSPNLEFVGNLIDYKKEN